MLEGDPYSLIERTAPGVAMLITYLPLTTKSRPPPAILSIVSHFQ
jgi:hypothetical protein